MNNKISTILEEYGFDKKEITVYISLVENSELNAYALAKITGIHRSTTYAVIERLSSKGFISEIQKGEKTFYSAIEIGQIISKIKEKEALLSSLIPEFENIREEGVSRVRVFESRDSQKQFNFSIFNKISQGSIRDLYVLSGGPSNAVFSDPRYPDDMSSNILLDKLFKEMRRQKLLGKIDYQGIWNEKLKSHNLVKLFSALGENKFLKELPTLATTVIFGEYVAYMFTMNGTPQVIEIQNKRIAEENKAYFSYLWKIAKK